MTRPARRTGDIDEANVRTVVNRSRTKLDAQFPLTQNDGVVTLRIDLAG